MILARVLGTVVSSRKDPSIEGLKLLAVQPLDAALKPAGSVLVAADSVGAGEGETVLLVTGSSARYTEVTTGKPSDTAIVAIVDVVESGGRTLYSKSEG